MHNILILILPKFDPDYDVLLKDHIKQFMLFVRLMNVEHAYVFCRLFPYTFVGKSLGLFFSLVSRSIAYWKQFETTFMTQFGDDKTSGIFSLELS